MRAKVVILGSTGSVGANVLEVIRLHPDKYQVCALAAQQSVQIMAQQCQEFAPQIAVLADPNAAKRLAAHLAGEGCATEVQSGSDAISQLADDRADIVVCAMVGAVGLRSTLAAVGGGGKVLIANKEPLVMCGAAIVRKARACGTTLLPLDSEHNAIFQCLPLPTEAEKSALGDSKNAGVRRIWLTASGGPFRQLPKAEFARVTPAQACAHPNWQMGRKISVDSATMFNKGLEIIEACALFGVGVDEVEVVIHPQSLLHSMVEYLDGSTLAQFGAADMRVAIANALGWPQRIASGVDGLDFLNCAQLEFHPPDPARFPALELAREAVRQGGLMPTVLNAANEVAVEKFLAQQLRFDQIPELVARVMEATQNCQNFAARSTTDADLENSVESVLAADAQARAQSAEMVSRLAK